MPNRISNLFDRCRAEKRAALIAYITAGDPRPDMTTELVMALERGGADLIELGVPFSDPIADGPVIQRGVERALQAGTTLPGVLAIAAEIRQRTEIPLLLFTYLNPAIRYGFARLASDARAAGIDGILFTDLSVEEAGSWTTTMQEAGLDTVFLAAPTSTPRRLALVAQYSRGFVYLVSRTGVTGERSSLSSAVEPLIAAMRQQTDLPLAVGFGINTPEQAAHVAGLADGVVVGSAIVRTIETNPAEPAAALEKYVRSLRDAMSGVHA
jgi:tryptophan synthase alpha chain